MMSLREADWARLWWTRARFYDPFNLRGRVGLSAEVREMPEAAFILSLGWYLLLLGRLLSRVRVPVMGGR